MVWNAGVGPWWAATAEIFKGYGFDFTACPHHFRNFRPKIAVQNAGKGLRWPSHVLIFSHSLIIIYYIHVRQYKHVLDE
jgi:hypothetical protein